VKLARDSRGLSRALRLLVPATVGLVVLVLIQPGWLDIAVRVYALFVAALALLLGVGALRRAYPATRPLLQPQPSLPPGERPSSLTRLESDVALGSANALDLHYRLRPRLHRVARERLARRGIALERDPERARLVLGEETWSLVREDRLPPSDRRAVGLSLAALGSVVESLERIS